VINGSRIAFRSTSCSPETPAIEVQEIEDVIDEPHLALAVGRRLGVGEARQSSLIDAAGFAVDVGGPYVQVRERDDGPWIFCRSNRDRSGSGVAPGRYRCARLCDSPIALFRAAIAALKAAFRPAERAGREEDRERCVLPLDSARWGGPDGL
jgi:hypothetical protein